MNGETEYLKLVQHILDEGVLKENRTGVGALTVPHMMLQHDMSEGFPILTTKRIAWKTLRVELEFFLKGMTDKKWLIDRGCHIWDSWSNPTNDDDGDLGPIYGYQWRRFNEKYKGQEPDGIDQVRNILDMLDTNPNDRRMLCCAWNPQQLHQMALPPCHVLWHLTHINGVLSLSWFQRSCDMFLGIPFNLASYALLLHLLCKESGLKEGVVTGFLSDCHIYENHADAVKEQLLRQPFALPQVETRQFTSLFDWEYGDTNLNNYQAHPSIKAPVAV
ncbi:MAG: thymidylate synthase [Planctomycetota bacterium]|nr:thymidylate synthase [Planctomycetota bacterium]MDA1139527.1 thymidylate synthase [Planctomycetota bacterium]